MKKFVPLVTLLLLLVFMFTSACADIMYAFCKPGDIVNIREFPSSQSKQVGRLDCGDVIEADWHVTKDKHGGEWVMVYGLEGDAWVSAKYLSKSPVTIVEDERYAYSVGGRVALRRAPNGKRIGWLIGDDEVRVLAYTDEWILTKRGYVKSEFVEVYHGRVE